MLLDVRANLPESSIVFSDDPKLGPAQETSARSAMMGDMVRVKGKDVEVAVEAIGSGPIERLAFFNGATQVAEVRGYKPEELGRRTRAVRRRGVSGTRPGDLLARQGPIAWQCLQEGAGHQPFQCRQATDAGCRRRIDRLRHGDHRQLFGV